MHVVELFLPLDADDKSDATRKRIDAVLAQLTERFGGATAFLRSPATGLWKKSPDETDEDQIIIVEAMVRDLDEVWWRGYRRRLEREFDEDELLIRAIACRVL